MEGPLLTVLTRTACFLVAGAGAHARQASCVGSPPYTLHMPSACR